MINNWLNQIERKGHKYKFAIIDISEKVTINDDVKNYLALALLQQFRDIRHLKRMFEHEPKSKLTDYIQKNIFPSIDTSISLSLCQLNKNVRQGDWGEVLTSCVALDMRRVNAPVKKLKYKMNKEKSLLGIDVLAFEEDDSKNLVKAIFFESKTRTTYNKKIGIEAYESIYNNSSQAFSDMLNFISNFYYEKEDFEMSDKYDALIKEPNLINKDYHSFIIMEKGIWKSDILDCLDNEKVKFDDVYINVFLIDNIKVLIDETYDRIEKIAEEVVYG